MKKMLPFLLCFLALTACDLRLPPVEAIYTTDSITSQAPYQTELTPDQVKVVTDWIAANQKGWKSELSDNPPARALILKHPGGKFTRVELRGAAIWIHNQFKTLTPEESATFAALLEPQPSSPNSIPSH